MSTLTNAAFFGRERVFRDAALVATFVAAVALSASPAEARKKVLKDKNGCTAGDVQLGAGAQCIDKNYTPAGLANNRHGFHFEVKCAANGTKQCCLVSTKTGENYSCEQIRTANTAGTAADPSGMGVERSPKVRKNYSIAPGILDSGPSLGTQGPARTGEPLGGGKSAPPPAKIY